MKLNPIFDTIYCPCFPNNSYSMCLHSVPVSLYGSFDWYFYWLLISLLLFCLWVRWAECRFNTFIAVMAVKAAAELNCARGVCFVSEASRREFWMFRFCNNSWTSGSVSAPRPLLFASSSVLLLRIVLSLSPGRLLSAETCSYIRARSPGGTWNKIKMSAFLHGSKGFGKLTVKAPVLIGLNGRKQPASEAQMMLF